MARDARSSTGSTRRMARPSSRKSGSTRADTDKSGPSERRRATPTRWIVSETPALERVAELANELKLSIPFARILVRRGFTAAPEINAYLDNRLDALHDPMTLPDMDKACARIRQAIEKKERVVLFGDYDVDGVSSTALMHNFFRLIDFPTVPMVPERDRGGYGLSAEAVNRIRAEKPDLLITMDNGISEHEALAALTAEGVDCIVVDHHHVPEQGVPPVVAVVHPGRPDADYPFADLCGAGVTFKLAWALATELSHNHKVSPQFRAFLLDALALAALGTLADVVPLRGENRILAARGLTALAKTQSPGLQALMRYSTIEGVPSATDVTFRIAPRINAAGRCNDATRALTLLTTQDADEAESLAGQLDAYNTERQGIEQRILEQARAEALARMGVADPPRSLVLYGTDWHAGVIGIVASRLVEEFHRPTVLLAVEEAAGIARGSGRSIKGFHLAEAFAVAQASLNSFGGHAAAAGCTARAEALEAFAADIEAVARERLTPAMLEPALRLDEATPLSEVSAGFCHELQKMEPCGVGNPRPMLAALKVGLAGHIKPMGREERHVSFFARQDDAVVRAVGFGMGEHFNTLCELGQSGTLDIAFRPELNTFRGQTSVQLKLSAFRRSIE